MTIIGSNFDSTATVTFGGVAGTNVTVSNGGTQITVTTPANPVGAVAVTVTNQDTKATATQPTGFTYTNAAPTITSVAPVSGPTTGGTTITINGTGFVATPTVSLGGVAATNVIFVNSTQITAVTPAHGAAGVDVLVTNPDLQSADLPTPAFTFVVTGGNLIQTTTISVGNPTAPYYATLLAVGGTPPYTWSVSAGTLPPGLSLNSATGVISGIPSVIDSSNVTFQVTDSSGPPIVSTQTIVVDDRGSPVGGAASSLS